MSSVLADWTGGINAKADPWKLAPNEWQTLSNVVTRNGRAEPLKGIGSVVTTVGAGTLAALYQINGTWFGSTSRRWHVNWQSEWVAYVTEGAAPPQWTNGTGTVDLGLARPTSTPTIALGGTGITGTDLSWVFTYYDAYDQESGPSAPSAFYSPANQAATVTFTTGPAGTVGRKIYRVNNGTYQLAKTVADNVATSVVDDVATLNLGDPLLTEDANPAPSLEGLAIGPHQARLWGWTGSRLYYSNVGTPWAWDYAYITMPANVVAAAPAPGGLLVLTTERAHLITGYNEDTFALQSPMNTFGCAAPFSIAQTDAGIVWWDDQGLVLYDGNQFTLLTSAKFDNTDIAGFSTTGMKAAYCNGFYYLWHSGGTLVCDMRNGATFTTSTLTTGAAFVSTAGTLYVTSANGVYEWDSGDNLTMTLRTRQFTYEDLRRPFHGRRADVYTAGSATPQWYRGGSQWGTYSAVPSDNGVSVCWSIPGNRGRPDFQVSSTAAITQIEINPERK